MQQKRSSEQRKRERSMPREPCLICCPLEQVPDRLREFVAELRRDHPPNVLEDRGVVDEPGRKRCWNCAGRGLVDVVQTSQLHPPIGERQ